MAFGADGRDEGSGVGVGCSVGSRGFMVLVRVGVRVDQILLCCTLIIQEIDRLFGHIQRLECWGKLADCTCKWCHRNKLRSALTLPLKLYYH